MSSNIFMKKYLNAFDSTLLVGNSDAVYNDNVAMSNVLTGWGKFIQ